MADTQPNTTEFATVDPPTAYTAPAVVTPAVHYSGQTPTQPINIAGNKTWLKLIPRLNIGFMIVSLLLLLTLDLTILISSPELASFFVAMVRVVITFGTWRIALPIHLLISVI